MLFRKKSGFTLVELLVVISIIGILAAALTAQFTNVRKNAQAMKCKTNLHNLAQAALSYAVDTHAKAEGRHCPEQVMPWAGSYERAWAVMQNGKYVRTYIECPGWVAWTGPGRWQTREMQSGQMKKACYFGSTAYESITNGTLWSYVGKDLAAYACEAHRSVAKRAGLLKVQRSYVMNGYFGFDHKGNPTPANMPDARDIRLDALSARGNAGNLLLFAELPAFKGSTHVESVAKDENGTGSDGVLEADIGNDSSGKKKYTSLSEVIGFNHQVAKRYVAHVAFADGHVEVLVEPRGASDTDLKELAKQLCNGDEISQVMRDKMR